MNLESYYLMIVRTQQPTAVLAKVTLLLVFAVLATNSLRQSNKLLTGAFGALFFVGAFLPMGEVGQQSLVALAAVIALAGAIVSLTSEEATWKLLPDDERWRWFAIAAYVLAFWFPFWPSYSSARQLFLSPFGSLPHQPLMVACIACAASYPSSPRVFALTACAASAILAVGDLVLTQRSASLILLAPAGVLAFLVASGGIAKGVVEDDLPSKPVKPVKNSVKDDDEPPNRKSGRKWDLQ
jgi:hypothetical protein